MIKLCTVVLVVMSGVFAHGLSVKSATSPIALVPTPVQPAAKAVVAPTAPAIPTTAVNTSNAAVIPAPVNVKSFKEWKNEQVQIAIKRITIIRAQIEYRKLNKQFLSTPDSANAKDLELEKLEIALKNAMYALDVAREFGISEFFAFYLIKQENKTEAYKEAAEKMSPEEVGQLIKAYADSMFSTNGTPPSATKVGPTAMEKPEPTH